VLRFVSFGAFAKLRKATIRFVKSIRPHSSGIPLDGLQWHLIFEHFPKICPVSSSFIKIWQELRILNMKTYIICNNISLNSSNDDKWFRQNLQRISKHILYVLKRFLENLVVSEMWKIWYRRTVHRWQYNTAHALCMFDKEGCTHTHTHTHTHTTHTHTHTQNQNM